MRKKTKNILGVPPQNEKKTTNSRSSSPKMKKQKIF